MHAAAALLKMSNDEKSCTIHYGARLGEAEMSNFKTPFTDMYVPWFLAGRKYCTLETFGKASLTAS